MEPQWQGDVGMHQLVPCSHRFCGVCITEWSQLASTQRYRCPVCRQAVVDHYQLESKHQPTLDDAKKNARERWQEFQSEARKQTLMLKIHVDEKTQLILQQLFQKWKVAMPAPQAPLQPEAPAVVVYRKPEAPKLSKTERRKQKQQSEDAATVERIAPTKLKKLLELAALQLNEAMGKAKTVLEDLSTAERKDREAHLKVSTEKENRVQKSAIRS